MSEHGTITRYKHPVHPCRCEPCRAAWSHYGKNRTRQKAYGRWAPYVDTARAREHLSSLAESGMGVRRIEELSGVAHPVLTRIRTGRTVQIRPETEARILAVQPGSPAGGARIASPGSTRRLQALVALGWTAVDMADRSDLSSDTLLACIAGENVTVRTAALIRDLYDRMWDQVPPESTRGQRMKAQRARAKAARNGWAKPMDWDEDAIDDPESRPAAAMDTAQAVDEVAVELALNGERVPLNMREAAEVVRIGTERGMSAAALAEAAGRSVRSVQRRRAA